MPYVTFEVQCTKCGQLFRDRTYSVDASDSFIAGELARYRRLGDDAHWLCNRCLTVPDPMRPSEGQQASSDQASPSSVKSDVPAGPAEEVP